MLILQRAGPKLFSRTMGFHWILPPFISELLEATSSEVMGPKSSVKPQKQLTINPP